MKIILYALGHKNSCVPNEETPDCMTAQLSSDKFIHYYTISKKLKINKQQYTSVSLSTSQV